MPSESHKGATCMDTVAVNLDDYIASSTTPVFRSQRLRVRIPASCLHHRFCALCMHAFIKWLHLHRVF